MSFIPVLQYGAGIVVFCFVYWIANGILEKFVGANVHVAGNVFFFFNYLWIGVLVVYIVFGGWWLIRKYNESEYSRGGMV